MNPSVPVPREKPGWITDHQRLVKNAEHCTADFVLVGDSIMSHYNRYQSIWNEYLNPQKNVNFGIPGDCTQHVLWRIKYGLLPLSATVVVIHVGTNNVPRNKPIEIATAILQIASMIRQRNQKAKIVVTGLLPRGLYPSLMREKIVAVNHYLELLISKHDSHALYLQPENNWLHPDGTLNVRFFYKDKLHLSKEGYRKFSLYIRKILGFMPNFTYISQ